MQSHSGCEFLFPIDTYVGLLPVPAGMGVLKPPGNGLYLLQDSTTSGRLPSIATQPLVDSDVALTAQCDFGTYGLGISTCRAYTLSMTTVSLFLMHCLAL
jgi:hypothetical protein